MATPSFHPEYAGWWRISESQVWGSKSLDLLGPALLSIGSSYGDRLRMLAIVAEVHCLFSGTGVSFTLHGHSEYDPISGTGRVKLRKDGRLSGTIRLEGGNESTFLAERTEEPSRPIELVDGRKKWRR
jgi:hypothetical protein